MARIYEFEGVVPVAHPSAFIHPDAVLIGDVIVGAGCYIGPCASLRGDFGQIIVGEGTNIQDSCTLHAFPEARTTVAEDCHVGHGAILHGCTIDRGALVGMNAVIMDGAHIGARALVGACAFVKAGLQVPPRCVVSGNPAVVVRELSDAEVDWRQSGTRGYQELARRCLASLRPATPLAEVPKDRTRVDWGGLIPGPLHEQKKNEVQEEP